MLSAWLAVPDDVFDGSCVVVIDCDVDCVELRVADRLGTGIRLPVWDTDEELLWLREYDCVRDDDTACERVSV